MKDKKLQQQIFIGVCIGVAVCLLLGIGCILNALLLPLTQAEPPEVNITEPTQPPTEAPTEPSIPALSMPVLELNAKHSFLYIVETDQFLMLKGNEDDKIYPASITKLFSAYVALLYIDADAYVTVGNEALQVPIDSSKAGLTPGDVLTVRQLVEAMLLPSGNDAAMTLAAATGRKLAGDNKLSYQKAIARFVEEMNAVAQKEGLTGSHFENPDGYHNKNHYTTCRDMQKIGVLALSQMVIREVMATPKVVVDLAYDYPGGWKNTNFLIQPNSEFYNPAAIGMKTGSTAAAGNCLMSAFSVEGKTVIVGIFGCLQKNDRFVDAQKIFDAYTQQRN